MTGGSQPTWDVDLRRRLTHGQRSFDLQVRFVSHARRLVLFGPSGAGKSQTLQMVAGLAEPDAGHVRLLGADLTRLPARQRRLGFVFQDYALFPHLNVAQNIAFGLRKGWRNAGRGAAEAAVAHWLSVFQLDAVARLHPEQISGGQRQRTALARALAAEPSALLLDEPFAALDAALRARLRDELADLLARLALPLILISHDDADVRQFGDDVVELRDGRVAGSGT